MISLTYNPYHGVDLQSELRDLKLKIINGDYNFKFSESRINMSSNELEFISNSLESDDIISGSLALKLYGLLDRPINDIDIIIKDKDRYDFYTKDYYGHSVNSNNLDTRLGYRNIDYKKGFFFRKKRYKVDFFENVGSTFNELDFNGFKLNIHNPMELLTKKIMLSNDSKHLQDLVFVFKSINLDN